MATSLEQLRSLKLPVVTKTSRKEPIGTGSYASVYEVMVHETVCAAKEMHILLMSETKKRAFLAECVRCSRILHPNVVQFLGIHYPSPDAQLPWLVMELMYISLTGLIEKYEQEDFPFHFKLSILMDTCQGIQFLHSQNIIHRDLSSNNILLTKHLIAKVADLGVAKAIPPGLHKHTMVPGTAAFMPPETLIDESKYGLPIDVFSFGCVCVHVVSMVWPTPKNQITVDRVVLSEVERREHYMVKMMQYPSLKELAEQCLCDEPDHRPVIKEVIKSLKTATYTSKPHENDSVVELFNSVSTAGERILQKDQQLMTKDNHLIVKDQQLSQKDDMLCQKDEELKQKDKLLSEKDQEMLQLLNKIHQQLMDNDQEMSKKDDLLNQKDQQLLQKDQEISKKDDIIIRKDRQLVQKDQEVFKKDELLNQKEWQLKHKDQEIFRNEKLLDQKDQELMKKDQQMLELLNQKDQQLMQKDQKIFKSVELLYQKSEELMEKNQQMLKKDELLIQKDQQLKQKDKEIAILNQKDQQLMQKDQEIFKNVELLYQKSGELVEKNQQILKKDELLIQKDQQLKQKDKIIAILNQKDQQLAVKQTDLLLGQLYQYVIHMIQQLVMEQNHPSSGAARLAVAMQSTEREDEVRGREMVQQHRIRELQEVAKHLEKVIGRRKQEEEKRKRQEEIEVEISRRAAIEHHKKQREHVIQLLFIDLKQIPNEDIKEIMKKFGLNPAGCFERSDLITALKEGVPELYVIIQTSGATAYTTQRPKMASPLAALRDEIDNMDHDLLQSVAKRIRNADLQRAEPHQLRSLIAQAQLRVKDYPDRSSMIEALKHVLDAAQRTRNRSSYFDTVHQSNNLSADDTNISKIERRAEMAEKKVEELEDMRCQQSAQIEELQRSLTEKNQKIESLNAEVRRLEVLARNAELSGRNTAPKPVPRQCMTSSGNVDAQQPSAREQALGETLRDNRILFSCTKEDFRFISLLNEGDEGVVVKAKCEREELTSTDKTYAIKILTNYYQDTSTVTRAREEFKNEYEILGQLLPHPNILQLHAFFYDRMDPHLVAGMKSRAAQNRSISLFMVMDYQTLDMEDHIKDLFEQQGPKNGNVLKWFTQLLSALAYLDTCHIVHRDLKLKNILLSKDGNLKLCDFGSAIKLAPEMTLLFQRGMKLPGNRAHQSPELRSPKANQTINMSKADVWAAGILAFEMCGHSNPFDTIDALGYTEDQLPQLMYTRCRGSIQAFPLPSGFTTLVNSLLIYYWKRRPSAKDALSSAQRLSC